MPSVRRPMLAAFGLAAALHLAAAPAAAQVLTYNGDPIASGYASWTNNPTNSINQIVFDNFRIGAGSSWTVTGVYGSFRTNNFSPAPTTLAWQIRQGMGAFTSTGTVVAAGSGAFSLAGDVYTLNVTPFALGAGEYWLGMWADLTGTAPITAGTPLGFSAALTTGANAVNAIGDAQAFWLIGADASNVGGTNDPITADFSYGVLGRQAQVVPEPAAVALLGAGLVGLLAVGRGARRRAA